MQYTENIAKDFMFDMMTKMVKMKAALKLMERLYAMIKMAKELKKPIDLLRALSMDRSIPIILKLLSS